MFFEFFPIRTNDLAEFGHLESLDSTIITHYRNLEAELVSLPRDLQIQAGRKGIVSRVRSSEIVITYKDGKIVGYGQVCPFGEVGDRIKAGEIIATLADEDQDDQPDRALLVTIYNANKSTTRIRQKIRRILSV
jgi:hypothetical protein